MEDLCIFAELYLHAVLKHLEGKMAEVETADEILESISDKEAVERFGTQVLQALSTEELLGLMTTEEILSVVPTEELVGAAAKRVYSETFQHPVIKEFITEIQGKQQQQVRLTPAITLPKVVCLGMLPKQQSVMQQALRQVADLKFVEQDRNTHSIPANADWYVVWARFSSHAMNDKAKSLAKPGRFILHTGGVTGLISKLQNTLSKGRKVKV